MKSRLAQVQVFAAPPPRQGVASSETGTAWDSHSRGQSGGARDSSGPPA